MTSTSITLSPQLKAQLAPGSDMSLEPVKNWDLNVLAGAGALRSTANDVLKFMSTVLAWSDTPLKPAMRRMLSVGMRPGTPDLVWGGRIVDTGSGYWSQSAMAVHLGLPKAGRVDVEVTALTQKGRKGTRVAGVDPNAIARRTLVVRV